MNVPLSSCELTALNTTFFAAHQSQNVQNIPQAWAATRPHTVCKGRTWQTSDSFLPRDSPPIFFTFVNVWVQPIPKIRGITTHTGTEALPQVNQSYFYSKFAPKPVSQAGSEGPTLLTSFPRDGSCRHCGPEGSHTDVCPVMLIERSICPKIAALLI